MTSQEALRSLGALLDSAAAPRAVIAVDDTGIAVEAPGGFGHRELAWGQIAALSASRVALRGRGQVADLPPLTRWEVLLRLAGRAIDELGLHRFELHAVIATLDHPQRCYLEVTTDGRRLLGEAELVEQLQQIEAIRRARGDAEQCGEAERASPPQ